MEVAKRAKPSFVLAALVFAVICPDAGEALEPPRIDKVSVNPKTVDLSRGETVTLHFETTEEAFLGISLRDEDWNQIHRFELGLKPAGMQTLVWDGRDKNGAFVSTYVVIYSIDARTEDNRYAHYDPAPQTGGLETEDMKFTLERETGLVSYILPKASRVRLRAGLVDGALLNTLYDWRPEEAGRHEFSWNGLDKSGEMNLLEHPKLNMNLNAFSLPDNTIIVKGVQVDYSEPNPDYHAILKGKHFHYPHPRIYCHEARFQVSFPPPISSPAERGRIKEGVDWPRDERGIVMLKGKVPVRVELDPKDREDLIRKRFEVIVYVDTQFLFEEEQAVSPATFYWDVSDLNTGEHLLTVNLMSYDDHVGTETVKVEID